jgi:uncharacterized coiled-coil protein SlyX
MSEVTRDEFDRLVERVTRVEHTLGATVEIVASEVVGLRTYLDERFDHQDRMLDDFAAEVQVEFDRHAANLAGHGAMLAAQSATLAEHGAMLAEQIATLAEQGAMLAEQSATLAEHGAMLAEHGATLAQQNASFAAQGAKLDALLGHFGIDPPD